jgi:hypothetical protein
MDDVETAVGVDVREPHGIDDAPVTLEIDGAEAMGGVARRLGAERQAQSQNREHAAHACRKYHSWRRFIRFDSGNASGRRIQK